MMAKREKLIEEKKRKIFYLLQYKAHPAPAECTEEENTVIHLKIKLNRNDTNAH